MIENIWEIKKQATTEEILQLNHDISEQNTKLELPNPILNLLLQRNITQYNDIRKYFKPSVEDLYNPFLMKDMDIAVERILRAIDRQEKLMIYGDYDVDGTTSVAMMYLFLKKYFHHIQFYLPDRYEEGYGVSEQGIEYAKAQGIELIISLDCGVKDIQAIQLAKDYHIDFIVCDHHLPSEVLPPAYAILNPQRHDCDYPYKYLSGCGVGFKLIQALSISMKLEFEEIEQYLDLVAISIAADIVPLTDENKTLAYYGLNILKENPRTGIKVMIDESQKQNINISYIVFNIAPKINAAGRIEHATKAVELLIEQNEMNARNFIKTINEINQTRKELDANITEHALQQIVDTKQSEKSCTIVYNPEWHKGVIGIVASRLMSEYYKPTLVFTKGKDNELVASARSVKDFDVYAIIDKCRQHLNKYGGHMYAAGLSLDEENFESFKSQFEFEIDQVIEKKHIHPIIEIDMELEFNELNDKLFRIIHKMQPFGPENNTPIFLTRNIEFYGYQKLMGKQDEHLKFTAYKNKYFFEVVCFGMGHLLKKFKKNAFDLTYSLETNYWQGKTYYNLMAKDVKFHE